MKVPIGHDPEGEPVCVDLRPGGVLVIVGDPGCGATTMARFLARWWIADADHSARIFAERPHEYTDLMTARSVAVHPIVDSHHGLLSAEPSRLTMIDRADACPSRVLTRGAHGAGPMLITSHGEAARALHDSYEQIGCSTHARLQCMGLVPRNPQATTGRLLVSTTRLPTLAWDGAQGRLDWPADITPVVADARGARDLPVHRWSVPEAANR